MKRQNRPFALWEGPSPDGSPSSDFLEVYGNAIRKGSSDNHDVAACHVWKVTVPAAMRTIELAGPPLMQIRVTLQCFTGRHGLSQEWGRAVMLSRGAPDEPAHIGRRCGKPYWALFGEHATDEKLPDQKSIAAGPCGPIAGGRGFGVSSISSGRRL